MEISRNLPPDPFQSLMVGLGTVMAPLGVSFGLLMCYNEHMLRTRGLVEVDLSAVLDPFDSNQLMLCPWAMSFFERLCAVPFPPVSQLLSPCTTTRESMSHNQRSHTVQQRSHTVQQRSHTVQQRSHTVQQRSLTVQQRSHMVQQRSHTVQQRSHMVQQRSHVLQLRPYAA